MRRRKSLRATAGWLVLPTPSTGWSGEGKMKGGSTVSSTARAGALPLDHHLEIFARQHQRSVPRAIAALDQLEQLAGESRLAFRIGIERREGPVHRAVPGAEDLDEVLRRSIAEEEVTAERVDGHRFAEELLEARTGAPERGGFEARGRRQVLADGLEQLPDAAGGSPVAEADAALRLSDPR